ncbi:alpha/beta fold hydrolase [Curtobacterium sp. ER1/6]|uniref:alpha/beta fold hydrolase n=1 Tax=Curtobacterium sp. ER1/6 TaxID=1891920 RepID=UPI00086A4CDB|nr:alpha/beta hydrolase [Curtobacterium sp. ER1/6]
MTAPGGGAPPPTCSWNAPGSRASPWPCRRAARPTPSGATCRTTRPRSARCSTPTTTSCFLQDADGPLQRDAFARTTSQDAAAFGTTTTRTGWADVDSTAVVCTDDRSTTVALQRSHAARATASVELPTGHHPFISRPDLVVDLLEPLLA